MTEEAAIKTAPNKGERQKCWDGRDVYFECMEKNEENHEKCLKQFEAFKGVCSNSWVKYFVRRRVYLKYSEKLEQGFVPEDQKQKQG